MVEQDGRGSLSVKSKLVLYLPPRQRAYNRAMSSVERPSGIASEGGTFEGIHGGIGESGARAGGLAKGEPYPASLGNNRGHPCCAEE